MSKTSKTTCTLDRETLARAVLTFCLDGANALMFALLKGCTNAQEALELLRECRPESSKNSAHHARQRLAHHFAIGIARWGRTIDTKGMQAFHREVDDWHRRMRLIPSWDPHILADWFTVGGTQWIIAPHHSCWPHQLDDLAIRKDWATPLCLWGRGDVEALSSCSDPIAIVGSRGVNDYGRYVARTVAERAASDGHLVISGGAMGADAAAHWGALAAMDTLGVSDAGRTIAIFAGGLNHAGPHRNRELFDRIEASHGALISEMCPDTIPEARRFLLRNRIIAAFASTVVVAQARLRSGALNTANWATEIQRDVYAAPGDVNMPYNSGCNALIHDGKAIILRSASHITDICHTPHTPITMPQFDSDESNTILLPSVAVCDTIHNEAGNEAGNETNDNSSHKTDTRNTRSESNTTNNDHIAGNTKAHNNHAAVSNGNINTNTDDLVHASVDSSIPDVISVLPIEHTSKERNDHDSTTSTSQTDTANQRAEQSTEYQSQALLTAIRRCKRRRIPPTTQSIADMMIADATPSAQISSLQTEPSSSDPNEASEYRQHVMTQVITGLGLLELDGVITMRDGIVVIVNPP